MKNNPEEIFLDSADVVEKELESRKVSGGEFLLLSVMIGISLFCIGLGISLIRDNSMQVFLCPTTQELDAPVSLKKITDVTEYEAEMYLRGFIRQIIRAFYPKNSEEAELLFKFAAEHTKGELHNLYSSYLKDSKKIGEYLDGGQWVDFFPVGPITKEESVRIVKQDSNRWVVEIEGFLNDKKSALEDDRGIVTLRLEVEKGDAVLKGSKSGLYVTKREYIYVSNPMANNKEVIK